MNKQGHTLGTEVSPKGRVVLRHSDAEGSAALDVDTIKRITAAFELGVGAGLLHLGAAEVDTLLPPTLAIWRTLGTLAVGALCGRADSSKAHQAHLPTPDPEALTRLAESVPPMRGGENISVALLEKLWQQIGNAAAARAVDHPGGLQGYLDEAHSVWHIAGRVCLHLAENPSGEGIGSSPSTAGRIDVAHRPFAFIATYARPSPSRGTVQHVPLSRALREYADAGDNDKLLALIQPLQRAAENSELIRTLIQSGDVYHPLAWTAEEAYSFLLEAQALERAGVVLRLPDWWSQRKARRPSVSVTVGSGVPSTLGLSALLDFDVKVTLGGETLTQEEIDQLLASGEGLLLIKGKWVDVNPAQLSDVLDHWQNVQTDAGNGVSFAEAMRMVAGAAHLDDEGDMRPQWSKVEPGAWMATQLDTLRSPEIEQVIADHAGLDAELRPYQTVGVQWLWTLQGLGLGGCLADDMGLGKTIQVIAVLNLLHAQAEERDVDLLVVPASLIDNWRAELARFSPNLSVFVAHASNMPSRQLKATGERVAREHQIVITTYGTAMRTPWMFELPWRAVVLDEAQAIKNPSAKQTRAIKRLPAQWRLALTGTPVENRLGDLWSIFDFLNPGLLGTARQFSTLCKAMASRPGDGYAPLRRLVSPYVLRRLKTDRRIITDLPNKIEMTAHCLLTKVQAALYGQAVQALSDALKNSEGIQRRGLVLASLLRFKQICNHPSLWLGDGGFNPAQSGKFQRLTELCAAMRERQEKVLVFTQFRTMTKPLQRHLSECFGADGLELHGGVPVKKRSGLVRRFQENEDVPFMVLSLKAGGTGLNLTAANHVVHFDRWWNPSVENQATDRAFRIGQQRNVVVHKFVCKGTVEERIDEMIRAKQALSDELLSGSAEATLTELSSEALIELVSLDLNSAVAT